MRIAGSNSLSGNGNGRVARRLMFVKPSWPRCYQSTFATRPANPLVAAFIEPPYTAANEGHPASPNRGVSSVRACP